MKRRDIIVTVNCVADHYVRVGGLPDQRIVEFSDSHGNGGLITFWHNNSGEIVVEVYRMDGVVVQNAAKESE